MAAKLYKASFRGVPFDVTESTLKVGRRSVTFEYPQRDIPFIEDLGRTARKITLSVVISGADYVERMNALIAELEKGAGCLVHPWLGSMTVMPNKQSDVSYSSALMTAKCSLGFVEIGDYVFPTTESDTAKNVLSRADEILSAAISDFTNKFSLDGVQDFVREAVAGNLASYFDNKTLMAVADSFGFSDSVASVISDALTLVDEKPSVLANKIVNAFGLGPYVTSVNAWRKVAHQFSSLLQDDSLNSSGSQTYVSGTTTETVGTNTRAVEDLVRAVSVSNAVGASANIGTELDRVNESVETASISYDEMMVSRDEILAALDAEMIRTDSADLYTALDSARLAVWEDMTKRAENDARLVDYTPPSVMPALVLAYDYYGDASRESEIIMRNDIRHGGFVPARTLKLMSN